MVAWSLKCNIWSYIFLDFHEPGEKFINSIYHVQNIIFILTECPFHTLFPQDKITISQFVRIVLDYKGQ